MKIRNFATRDQNKNIKVFFIPQSVVWNLRNLWSNQDLEILCFLNLVK